MMIVLLAGLALMRQVHLGFIRTTALPQDTAADICGTFVRFLKDGTRMVLVRAVITASAAYLYWPGRAARWVRRDGGGRNRDDGHYRTPEAVALVLGSVVLMLALLGILAAASGTAANTRPSAIGRSSVPGEAGRGAQGLS
ncbi:hypothetical protein [Streptomyces sediminimaris]|uniref:hypothetical protein n=1 Tax=Streptomyces sediminimaris TaxID=3383721 RepID=UPI00399A18DD